MILLIGSQGYIGRKIEEELAHSSQNYLAPNPLFITSYEETISLFEQAKPSIVINAAGFVGIPNVDACEEKKEETLLGNVSLPVILASVCEFLNIPLLHISSGCIYSGYKKDFTEEDEPNFSFSNPPCSFYSGAKTLAEKFLKGIEKKYILRLRIPFDEHDNPRNYLTKIQKYDKLLDAKNSITNLEELAEAVLFFCKERPDYGIYNVVNTTPITTKWVAEEANRILKLNKELTYWDHEEFIKKNKALRSNCVLDNTKLVNTGFKIRTSQEAVRDSLNRWIKS